MSCSKHVPSNISFAEIIHGRDATVRVTHDHMIYAVDLVMVMTGYDRNYAAQVLRGVGADVFHPDKMFERALSDKGGHKTKLVSFEHALELIMVLPGKIAKETRTQFADILKRYLAGDKSLLSEIQANSTSSSPIAQMARESLGISAMDEQLVGLKRRREELELLKLEEEIKGMTQNRILSTTAELERIRDPSRCNLDERTRLMIQDTLQNTILNVNAGSSKMITDSNDNAPISISSVAQELGYKLTSADAKRIGIDIKKRYLQQRGQAPPKHDQLCEGRVTQVNSYTARDRPILVKALRAYFSPPASLSGESVGSGESTIEIP